MGCPIQDSLPKTGSFTAAVRRKRPSKPGTEEEPDVRPRTPFPTDPNRTFGP
jgi:hypothetical protein